MLIKRLLEPKILEAAQEYPVVAIMGPRQSGKTTLAQMAFPDHRYISLEDFDMRAIAEKDPRKFLGDYPSAAGMILDEIQHAPHLLSYMQTIVDHEKKMGYFVVTGSQNFLVDQAITQTLAGRMAVFTLLPLSLQELSHAQLLPEKIETMLYQGSYPRIYAQEVSIERLYANYIRLYVERDVRQIRDVADLHTFQTFMRLCAHRIGQELNLTALGNDCGVTHNTAKAWISLLEASYIIFLVHPYYNNFGKRLVKTPKLYFIDTGIACSLLKISDPSLLLDHYMRGPLTESLIMSDLLKQQYNSEQQPSLYYWRDQSKHEIDCILDQGGYQIPLEIKSAKTIVADFFTQLEYWQILTKSTGPRYLVYGGSQDHSWSDINVLSWQSVKDLIQKINKKS